MKKYLAYCRVSTKAQADMDNSLPVQRRIITEYAQRKEFQIVEWYSEASSGFKGKRTEFHKMLERLGDHDIEGVVFHNCLLYTSPSPRDRQKSRMPSSA